MVMPTAIAGPGEDDSPDEDEAEEDDEEPFSSL